MYLYLIGAYSPKKIVHVKVGVTNDVGRRIADLQTGQANKIKLIKSWKCLSRAHAFECERSVHWRFRKNKMMGEWYWGCMMYRLDNYIAKLRGVTLFEDGHETRKAAIIERERLEAEKMLDIQAISCMKNFI